MFNGNSSNGVHKNGKSPMYLKFKSLTECPEHLEADFVYPDLKSKCTWTRNGDSECSPHTKRSL
jgi:hypothetical protein